MAKTRSGDKFPLDIKGEMIYLGSIVCIPIEKTPLDNLEGIMYKLSLGFVSKMTQKNGIDVTIMNPNPEKIDGKKTFQTKVFRLKFPAKEVNVIDRETLKTRDDYHEALRMAAGLVE